ncbi:hypothetical protein [Brachymonas sp.]|uniref:hypothetical protein n=1 Tax=Brachymonas sp. TaxID=1936292 RepID=UPI0035B2432F
MGWFSSVCSSVGSAIGSAVSSISSTLSQAYNTAKEYAGKAIGWMAEKAEGFVDGVKKVWQTVKPYVEHFRAGLRLAAVATQGIPWLSAALTFLEKGLGALTAFENSPIAKKIDEAIKWGIQLAQRWQERRQKNEVEDEITDEELEKARQHQKTMRLAEREALSDEERHRLELTSAINDYEIAKKDLALIIESGPSNTEHYLRLRATQKLLKMSDQKFRNAQSIDDLGADDLFIVRVASDLVKPDMELSKKAAERLDRLLLQEYGKTLQSFVYEELIASWKKQAATLETEFNGANKILAKLKVDLRRLENAKKVQTELDSTEAEELASLEKAVPAQESSLNSIAMRRRDIDRYADAAEGFLQLLEKSEEQLEKEDRSYVIDEGAAVGEIIVKVANKETPFSQLAPEDQSLINDFANIFRKEAQQRMNSVLEVSV